MKKSAKSPKANATPTPTPAPEAPPAPPVPMLDAEGKPLYGLLVQFAKGNRAELFTHAKTLTKFESAVDKAQDAFNGCKKFAGKVMAAMQVAYITALNSKDITPDTKFEKYYEDNVGAKPNNRIQALGRLFNRLVEMGHITEAIYDAQTVDALETANAALSAIEKKYKGTDKASVLPTTDEFKAVVNALHGLDQAGKPLIGTDTTKTLKALNKGLRGKATSEDADGAEDKDSDTIRISKLTPEIALQLWAKIVGQGHANICLLQLPDDIQTMSDEAQKSLVLTLDTVQERVYSAIGGAADIWIAEKSATLPSGVVRLHAGAPVSQAAAA